MKNLLLISALIVSIGANAQMPANIDSTFGDNGYAIVVPSANTNEFSDLTLTPNDEVLITGVIGGSNNDIYVAKWDKNGKTANNFGTKGLTQYDPQLGADDHGIDAIELPDGKILVIGTTDGNSNRDILIMRVNSDGTIDNTFGNNGYNLYNITDDEYVKRALVHKNHIYVGGYIKKNGVTTDAYVLCLKMDGTLELSFGTFGIVLLDINNDKQTLSGLEITADSSILVWGKTTGQSNKQYLSRLKMDGTVDTNFAYKGYFVYTEAGATNFNNVKYDGAGAIYICGSYDLNGQDLAFLMKLDTNGVISNTFGSGNGKVVLNSGAKSDQLFMDMELLEKGEVFMAGAYRYDGGIFKGLTAVFNPDGTLNTDYEKVGYKIAEVPAGHVMMFYQSVTKQQNGQLVLGGQIIDTNTFGAFACRYNKQQPPSTSVSTTNNIENQVVLSPNPSSGTINISSDAATVEQVMIYNASGVMIDMVEKNNVYHFTDNIANGLYYIRVYTIKGTVTKQVILNR